MVVVLMKNEGCNLQAAVDIVGEMCKRSIDRFMFASAQLPSWGAAVDGDVKVYVKGLAEWIVGSLHWSFETEGYFGREGGRIKKTKVVYLKSHI